ncbi:hypothetical protein U879_21055 [Defluviimonas sp. 20V17]|uniref:Uncharacterized protein n=1 Tax=Allgaiera indica TaxID=765699 RepID=A0AAN4UT97_9RHOB|nr:hypothetical protein [Allgaiera indica]KDB01693.1 hypothetical protein U879_21055 [Defluviimonas sp. 20V17]GHE04012.1 hypothetical protein GCM10008024_29500 [Allgaiera indica]SDX34260.1 hypothetical protein SAMN05444006_11431 [Allgaiera indica]
MTLSVRPTRARITSVALVALISFGGISAVAAPAHADGIFAQILPQILYGNTDDNGYRRAYHSDDYWRQRREREHFRRYYRREGDQRWRNNRDEGNRYRSAERGD